MHRILLVAIALEGCARPNPPEHHAEPATIVVPSSIDAGIAAPAEPPPKRRKPVTGYYAFVAPPSWIAIGPSEPGPMRAPRWELPRTKSGGPPIALEQRWIESEGTADFVRRVIDHWTKRVGPLSQHEHVQPIELRENGRAEQVGQARVVTVERSENGQAFVGAVIDLSEVDARTESAYAHARGLAYALEGAESEIAAARADFEALVRSVYLHP